MKWNIKKYIGALTTVTGAIALAFVGLTTVNAIGEGQIAGGNIYRIKNLTQNRDFAQTQTADKCDILQYKVRLHNPGPGTVNNVNVKASLPAGVASTNVSTVTITSENSQPSTVTATATLHLTTPQSVTYINGSTQLLDSNSSVLQTLPDTIMGAGVNIGNVGVSLNETKHVQFKAKVNCPEQPPCTDNPETPGDECNPKPPCKDNPKTPEDECNPKPPVTPPTPEQPGQSQPPISGAVAPSTLPDTGPGDIAAVFVIFSVAASAAYRVAAQRMLEL